MNALRRFLKNEDGAAEMIEATLLYPIVFICIGLLFYIGLFILQYITVCNYARKTAMLSAREVAYPGYITMITDETLQSSAAEIQLNDYDKSVTAEENKVQTGENEDDKSFAIHLSFSPGEVQARAYRYWSSDPLKGGNVNAYRESLEKMIQKNSILGGKESAEVSIVGKNYFIAQYVEVTAKQPLFDFALLRAFNIETPEIRAHAVASVNDTDEFIRNTDLAFDALEMIAKKLHIDVDGIRKKIEDVKNKLGLN